MDVLSFRVRNIESTIGVPSSRPEPNRFFLAFAGSGHSNLSRTPHTRRTSYNDGPLHDVSVTNGHAYGIQNLCILYYLQSDCKCNRLAGRRWDRFPPDDQI
jgi:hypothetical protein